MSGEAKTCNCTGECLSLTCPCFKRGRFCGPSCECSACKNCQAHEGERLDVMVDILTKDPTAFTANDMIDPEEYVSISQFARLTTSVDATPFGVEPRDQQQNPVAKLLSKKVVVQAVRTVMSAACENLKGSTPDTFEEMAENSVAKEFEVVLDTIVTHFKDK